MQLDTNQFHMNAFLNIQIYILPIIEQRDMKREVKVFKQIIRSLETSSYL